MRQSYLRTLLAAVLMFTVDGGLRFVRAEPFVEPPRFPSKNAMVGIFSCYDVRTGQLLNCSVNYVVEGLAPGPESDGGHEHDFGTHPVLDTRLGSGLQVWIGGALVPSAVDRTIAFQTQNDRVLLFHSVPEVAGTIQIQATVTPPPRYSCVSSCAAGYAFGVKVPGLTPLASSDDIALLRGDLDLPRHPEGQWGTPEALDALREIAKEYRERAGQRLSVNDLSLPWGGLFDFKLTRLYLDPHKTHREGTDADINQLGVPCFRDDKLRRAVEEVANRGFPVKLDCESDAGRDPTGPLKHINLQ